MEPIDLTVKNRPSEEVICASKYDSRSKIQCISNFEAKPIDLSMPTLLASDQGNKTVHKTHVLKGEISDELTEMNGLPANGQLLDLSSITTINTLGTNKQSAVNDISEPPSDRSLSDFSSPDPKYQYTLDSFHSPSDEKESPNKSGYKDSHKKVSASTPTKLCVDSSAQPNDSLLSDGNVSYEYLILPSDTSGSTEKSGNESFDRELECNAKEKNSNGSPCLHENDGNDISDKNVSFEQHEKLKKNCGDNCTQEKKQSFNVTKDSEKKRNINETDSSDETADVNSQQNEGSKSPVIDACPSEDNDPENVGHASSKEQVSEITVIDEVLEKKASENLVDDSIVKNYKEDNENDRHGKRKAECMENSPGSSCESEENDEIVKRMKYGMDYSEPLDEEESETFLINCSGDVDTLDDNVIKEIDDDDAADNDMFEESEKSEESDQDVSEDDFPFPSLITTKIPCDRVETTVDNDKGGILNKAIEEKVNDEDQESVDSADTTTYSPDVSMMAESTMQDQNDKTSQPSQSFDLQVSEQIFDMVFDRKSETQITAESKDIKEPKPETVKTEKMQIRVKRKYTKRRATAPRRENCLQNGASSTNQTKVRQTLIKYTCSLCEERFASARTYSAHLREVHNGEALMKCDFCEEEFAHHRALQKHMKSHPEVKIRFCPECNKSYDSASALTRHMLTHTGERPHQCTICDKRYMDAGTLTRHMVIHSSDKPFPCTICDKVFNRQSRLNTHMQMHNGETPHKCPICDKVFTESGNLKQHMMLHTGERPYKCDLCGKGFTKGASLRTHMLSHGDDKPHHCPMCGKSFANEGDMYNHIVLHNTEKAYKCPTCDKGFTHNSRLQRHLKTHTGEKPFFCKECGKGFAEAGHMRRHMLVHTGEKPFKCDICGKAFTQAGNLRAHMLIHGKEEGKPEGMSDNSASSAVDA